MDQTPDEFVARIRAAAVRAAAEAQQVVEPSSYTGTAADGAITAEVGIDGKVRSLSIDDASMRRPLADITEDVRRAINDALTSRPGGIDLTPMRQEIERVQDEARRGMADIANAIAVASQRIRSVREERG